VKFYEILLKLTAGLGTPIKGDTLFGHFCWQAAHDPNLLEGGLARWVPAYIERPFAVFSSAFPCFINNGRKQYALKKPNLPLDLYVLDLPEDKIERIKKQKEYKKKKWILTDTVSRLDLSSVTVSGGKELAQLALEELSNGTKRLLQKAGQDQYFHSVNQPHNTINRLTQTTGPAPFAPYVQEVSWFYPEAILVVFVMIDEKATDIERVKQGLARIGKWGYGRDASIGMGKFEITSWEELPLPELPDANAAYTLGPAVPEKDTFKQIYFTPFVRFGKHGDRLAGARNPFKNPVLMADEGAVFIPENRNFFKKPYLGQAIMGIPKTMPKTITQGYSIYLPLKMEVPHE